MGVNGHQVRCLAPDPNIMEEGVLGRRDLGVEDDSAPWAAELPILDQYINVHRGISEARKILDRS